jgi:hypothetical protein
VTCSGNCLTALIPRRLVQSIVTLYLSPVFLENELTFPVVEETAIGHDPEPIVLLSHLYKLFFQRSVTPRSEHFLKGLKRCPDQNVVCIP